MTIDNRVKLTLKKNDIKEPIKPNRDDFIVYKFKEVIEMNNKRIVKIYKSSKSEFELLSYAQQQKFESMLKEERFDDFLYEKALKKYYNEKEFYDRMFERIKEEYLNENNKPLTKNRINEIKDRINDFTILFC